MGKKVRQAPSKKSGQPNIHTNTYYYEGIPLKLQRTHLVKCFESKRIERYSAPQSMTQMLTSGRKFPCIYEVSVYFSPLFSVFKSANQARSVVGPFQTHQCHLFEEEKRAEDEIGGVQRR